MRKTYGMLDSVLPGLRLPKSCPITIIIEKNNLSLSIGPREWQWNLHSGDLISCGTYLQGENKTKEEE